VGKIIDEDNLAQVVTAASREVNSEGGTCFTLAFNSCFSSFNNNFCMLLQFVCCSRLRLGITHGFDMFT